MTKKLIHLDDHRAQLQCDNPECGYVAPEGALRWGEHLIGYECPDCGSDMLTRADFEASEKFYAVANWLNKWFGWLGRERDDPRMVSGIARTKNGKTTVEVDE